MLRRFVLVVFLSVTSLSLAAKESIDNRRLMKMFKEDQAARSSMPIDWAKVAPMDKAHRAEVLKLLRFGKVRSSNDFYHAAMIMQHGEAIEETQLAYSLSRLSVTLDPSNKRALWLSAASWDRILMSEGVPQWYGTQYHRRSPDLPMELYPVDESVVSDKERAAMNVPSLQEAKDLLQQINK